MQMFHSSSTQPDSTDFFVSTMIADWHLSIALPNSLATNPVGNSSESYQTRIPA